MSKAKRVREAINQDRAEEWKCRTCTQEAMENDVYCFHCRAYWDDVRAGAFDDHDNDLNDAWARGDEVER